MNTLAVDRRRYLKTLGDTFVELIAAWKATDGIEDEFFYTIPQELTIAIDQYRRELQLLENDRTFTAAELSIIAAAFRRGRDAMRDRRMRETSEQLYIAERRMQMRVYLAQRRYARFAAAAVLRLTSNFGTSVSRFMITTLLVDITFALFNMSRLNYGTRRPSFLTAFYWSTITLTTVGYGDILPNDEPLSMALACGEAMVGVMLIGILLHLLIRRLLIDEG